MHLLGEYKALAALARPDLQHDIAELAVAAGLFLVAAARRTLLRIVSL